MDDGNQVAWQQSPSPRPLFTVASGVTQAETEKQKLRTEPWGVWVFKGPGKTRAGRKPRRVQCPTSQEERVSRNSQVHTEVSSGKKQKAHTGTGNEAQQQGAGEGGGQTTMGCRGM